MDPITSFLWRTGTFLLLTAWLLGSGWLTLAFAQDTYAQWGSWHTYPVPDKRAMKHLVGLLVVLGLNVLFLWFAVAWYTT